MSIRFDDDERSVRLGVRDLAFVDSSGGLDSDLALPLSRLAMGRVAQGIHKRRARSVAHPDCIEVPIRFETRVLGYRVEITGRIDALVDDVDDTLVVEEVKTVFRRGDRLPRDPHTPGLEKYRMQTLVYAFLVETERCCPVRCRLALVSAADDTCVEIPLDYDATEVDRFLAARLERIIREYEEERTRRGRLEQWVEALEFPFPEHRPYQRELMESVREALEARRPLLLSAPAGTGKTIGALFPVLRHALAAGRRVFFVTAKNTQARMVEEMLTRLGVAGSPVRALFMRAKTQMCATGDLVCHEDVCPYLRDLRWKLITSGLPEQLLDEGIVRPTAVFDAAVEAGACPFYTAMSLTQRADVIVGDYNYVFDPVASMSHLFESVAPRDFVLVVDEAHNLPGRVMASYSPVLSRSNLRAASEALDDPFEPVHHALRSFLERLDRRLDEIREPLDDARDDVPIELDPTPFLDLRDELEKLLLRFLLTEGREPKRSGEDPVLAFFFSFAQLLRVLEMEELPKVVHYRFRPDESLRVLNVDPAGLIRDAIRGFGGALLMSATLAPIEFYRRSLGLEDPETLEVAFPTPFPPENRCLIHESSISTRYHDRSRAYPRVAALVQEVAALREGNYLCFFPSFRFLAEVARLMDPTRLELIEQRPSMGPRERADVLARLDDPFDGRPRVVFAVQGGIFAEGVDYAGDACIGVFVVGPGLPAVSFENECIRAYHDRLDQRGFEFAYLYPGMNRVIQSAGRLIRTETDTGILVLIGERFTRDEYAACLPEDWGAQAVHPIDEDELIDTAATFWEQLGSVPVNLHPAPRKS